MSKNARKIKKNALSIVTFETIILFIFIIFIIFITSIKLKIINYYINLRCKKEI